MPEGHSIRYAAVTQTPLLAGKRVAVSSPQGRFAEDARRIDGRKLERIEPRGKHLLYHFQGGLAMHVHLGRFGKFRQHDQPAPPPQPNVRARLTTAKIALDLTGPTTCHVIGEDAIAALHARIGPDPLDPKADPAPAWAKISRSRAPIGLLLMDQSVIAGIGNIYRTELLHQLRIHPLTPGRAMPKRQFNAIWKLCVRWLTLGAEHNRIITIDPTQVRGDAATRRRATLYRVFKKQDCPDCGRPLSVIVFGGRKAWVCETCQPLICQTS